MSEKNKVAERTETLADEEADAPCLSQSKAESACPTQPEVRDAGEDKGSRNDAEDCDLKCDEDATPNASLTSVTSRLDHLDIASK